MTTLAPADLLAALNWRYAVKKFDATRKIPADQWAALEQSLVLAPSSFGIQPWKFIVVESPAVRARLQPASWGQTQIVDASHLVVLTLRKGVDAAYITRFIERTAEVRGTTVEKMAPYHQVVQGAVDGATKSGVIDVWQSRQVYIAAGQFMTAAAVMGVDTCPIEGLEPTKYDEILGLKGTGYDTLCAIAAGYRAADDKYAGTPKVRFAAADVIERR